MDASLNCLISTSVADPDHFLPMRHAVPSASPTMHQIAERAGVGKATVSLALRDDPRLRPETRQRIQRLAAEMGYRTNPTVANLMAQLRASRSSKYQAAIGLLNASPDPGGGRVGISAHGRLDHTRSHQRGHLEWPDHLQAGPALGPGQHRHYLCPIWPDEAHDPPAFRRQRHYHSGTRLPYEEKLSACGNH